MNRKQIIDRYNELFPVEDPAEVYDFANALTENDTCLVPLNYVDELIVSHHGKG